MWDKIVGLLYEAVQWVRQVLPTAFSVGMAVYSILNRKISLLKTQVSQLALQLKYKENEKRVEEANKGKSDSDIVDELLAEGRKLDSGTTNARDKNPKQ